jgi:hypothetical protein
MLVLQLGTSNLNYRNYEYGMFQINRGHILARLDYFCSHFNSKGLGDLTCKVIHEQIYEMEDIWRLFIPEMQIKKSTQRLSIGSSKVVKKCSRVKQKEDKENLWSHPQSEKKLNNSMVSEIDPRSFEEDSFTHLEKSAFSRKKSALKLKDSNS